MMEEQLAYQKEFAEQYAASKSADTGMHHQARPERGEPGEKRLISRPSCPVAQWCPLKVNQQKGMPFFPMEIHWASESYDKDAHLSHVLKTWVHEG